MNIQRKANYNPKRKSKERPCNVLRQKLLEILGSNGSTQSIPDDIPTKWDKHGDLVLIPFNSLRDPIWQSFGYKVWDVIAEVLKCQRVARKNRIKSDDFRTPHTELLKGSDVWVTRIDNGIKFTFDVTKCMFSAGNISEKLRIAKFNCEGETVVDMYAGIGYFTLPYLVHAKASKVYACEWNPNAVEALKKNLLLNAMMEKCSIHFGDNKEVCPHGVADRVNLGLIPSSERGWETACKALKPEKGGMLHVHGVVTSGLRIQKQNDVLYGNVQMSSGQLCNEFIADSLNCEDIIYEYSNDKVHANNLDVNDCTTTLSNDPAMKTATKKLCKSHKALKTEWIEWSAYTCNSIKSILNHLHLSSWTVNVLYVNHVKSYAPHVDHIVLDIYCRPN